MLKLLKSIQPFDRYEVISKFTNKQIYITYKIRARNIILPAVSGKKENVFFFNVFPTWIHASPSHVQNRIVTERTYVL